MQVVMKGKATLQFLFPVLFCFFFTGDLRRGWRICKLSTA